MDIVLVVIYFSVAIAVSVGIRKEFQSRLRSLECRLAELERRAIKEDKKSFSLGEK